MKQIYTVYGMTCNHCKKKIEEELLSHEGIEWAKVNLKKKELEISYQEDKIQFKQIKKILETLDYELVERQYSEGNKRLVYLAIAVMGFWLLNGVAPDLSMLLTQGNKLNVVILFVIGVTTSFHCISMCGGIELSQVVSQENNSKRNILYNIGRIISYTLLGGLASMLGSGITLGNKFFSIVPIFLGFIMIMMGLNNIGLINLFETKMLQRFNIKIASLKNKLGGDKGPFVLGLVNGLMPCGPLQLMQVYALSTGSFVQGALAMFAFSLGTMPLMMGMGVLIQRLSIQARAMVFKVGGILIVLLGIGMMKNGLIATGANLNVGVKNNSISNRADIKRNKEEQVEIEDGYQVVRFDVTGRRYKDIVVQKDIPVKLIINVEQGALSSCNYALNIPQYDILTTLNEGENTIEFTPTETGEFIYSCWMGMIRNTITVVDEPVDNYIPNQEENIEDEFPLFNFGNGASCH